MGDSLMPDSGDFVDNNDQDIPTLMPEPPEELALPLDMPAATEAEPFYRGASRGYLRDLLLQLLEFSPQVPVLTGAEGSGKSVLLRAVAAGAPATWRVAVIVAAADMSEEEFFTRLSQQMNMMQRGKAEVSRDWLRGRFDKILHAGHVPVLLIDDAQLLPPRLLAMILDLAGTGGERELPLLRLALFGAPSLLRALDRKPGKPGSSLHLRPLGLPALKREQVREYIEFRAGLPGFAAGALTEARVDAIHRQSAGLPARINQCLLSSAPPVAHGKGGWRSPRVALMVVAALLVVMALTFQEAINRLFTPGASSSDARRVEELPLPPVKTGEVPPIVTVTAEPAPSTVADEQVGVVAETPVAEAPPEAPGKVEAPSQVEVSAATQEDVVAAEESVPAQDLAPVAEVAAPAVGKKTADTLKGVSWIQAQNAEHYTVRLMSLRQESVLREFMHEHKLTDQAAYYRAVRGNTAWYILIHGSYPDERSAQLEATRLSRQLKIKQPLIRKFGEIQQDAKG